MSAPSFELQSTSRARSCSTTVAGTPAQVKASAASITGRYLSGAERIETPAERRKGAKTRSLLVEGVSTHNLQAVTVAFPLGLMIGRMKILRQLLDPTINLLRPIPVTAWLPLSMIFFGLGPNAAIFLVFLGAFYPILLNTIFGVRSVDPRLFEAAACGTPIISDYWQGLETVLTPGRDILVARSTAEILEYLRELPEADRISLGQRGRRRVLAAHTAAHRAAELERHVLARLEREPAA